MAAKRKPLPRLTREQIKDAPDRPEVELDIPEWNGSIAIRGASKAAWDKFQELTSPEDVHYLLSLAIVDPVYSEDEVAELREKSVKAMERVEKAVLRACGYGPEVENFEARFPAGDQ